MGAVDTDAISVVAFVSIYITCSLVDTWFDVSGPFAGACGGSHDKRRRFVCGNGMVARPLTQQHSAILGVGIFISKQWPVFRDSVTQNENHQKNHKNPAILQPGWI